MKLHVTPMTVKAATAFVRAYHRHSKPPQGGLFAVGVTRGEQLVGVAIAGRPVARMLQDGRTVEVTRCCTTGEKNACSMLYGAICRAATALGYGKAVTYTLATERGTSLLASGFNLLAKVDAAQWSRPSRQRAERDAQPRFRWERRLTA